MSTRSEVRLFTASEGWNADHGRTLLKRRGLNWIKVTRSDPEVSRRWLEHNSASPCLPKIVVYSRSEASGPYIVVRRACREDQSMWSHFHRENLGRQVAHCYGHQCNTIHLSESKKATVVDGVQSLSVIIERISSLPLERSKGKLAGDLQTELSRLYRPCRPEFLNPAPPPSSFRDVFPYS